MKKLWQRFKNWLIHKLGGYTKDYVMTIEHAQVPLVTLTSKVTITNAHRYHFDIESIGDQILRDFADQLRDYIDIETYVNPMEDITMYRATIKIADRRKK